MKHEILTQHDRASVVTYSEEDGNQVIGHHMEMDPHIKHVKMMRDIRDQSTRMSNPNEWALEARVPIPILTSWLRANGFTLDQWARNEGGTKGKSYPESKNGVKDMFLRFFLSRDYSKLHNTHLTTKQASSQIVVPERPGVRQ